MDVTQAGVRVLVGHGRVRGEHTGSRPAAIWVSAERGGLEGPGHPHGEGGVCFCPSKRLEMHGGHHMALQWMRFALRKVNIPLQISIQGNFVSLPGLVTVTDFHLLCILLLSSINTSALPTIKYNKDRNQVSKTLLSTSKQLQFLL